MKKNHRLKIGILLDDTLDSTDGVQQYCLTLGKWLSRRGHEVHYIAGQTSRNDIKNIHSISKNITVKFNQNKMSMPLPVASKKIKSLLKELDLDVLHVQMPYSPFYAAKFIKFSNKKTKIIGTFHIVPANRLSYLSSFFLKFVLRNSLKKIDQTISVSEVAKKFALESFGIKSFIIPNAIDSSEYKYEPIIQNKIKIVFLGRMVERKGCLQLLQALKVLDNLTKYDYEVIVAGDGPLRPKLEQYAKENNLRDISFLGYVSEEEKKKLLSNADIATFPALGGESFGIVLIEAMACGSRVIIGGDNLGYSGVLGNDDRFIVNPKDSEAFANLLKLYIENSDIRISVSKVLKKMIKKYDINNVGEKIIKLYVM